jgi:hypothetical protein
VFEKKLTYWDSLDIFPLSRQKFMKQEKKNKKEWQSVLLWGGGIATSYFMLVIPLGSLVDSNSFLWLLRILVLILLVLMFLWGVISGALCNTERRFSDHILIQKSIFIFLVFIVIFTIELSTWIFVIDPYDYGSFTQTFISTYTHGFFDLIFIYSQPFIIGYLIGFIPSFLIRHALQLYRKHFKHIFEPC